MPSRSYFWWWYSVLTPFPWVKLTKLLKLTFLSPWTHVTENYKISCVFLLISIWKQNAVQVKPTPVLWEGPWHHYPLSPLIIVRLCIEGWTQLNLNRIDVSVVARIPSVGTCIQIIPWQQVSFVPRSREKRKSNVAMVCFVFLIQQRNRFKALKSK